MAFLFLVGPGASSEWCIARCDVYGHCTIRFVRETRILKRSNIIGDPLLMDQVHLASPVLTFGHTESLREDMVSSYIRYR